MRMYGAGAWIPAIVLICVLGAGTRAEADAGTEEANNIHPVEQGLPDGTVPDLVAAEAGSAFEAPEGGQGVPDLGDVAVRMSAALAGIIGFVLIGAYAMRRVLNRYGGGAGREGIIRVRATRYLGSRNTLSVVDIEGEHFVIGLSSQGISFFMRLRGAPEEEETKSGGGSFEQVLRERKYERRT